MIPALKAKPVRQHDKDTPGHDISSLLVSIRKLRRETLSPLLIALM